MDDIGKKIIYKDEVTSTNDIAKDIAKRTDSHGSIIIAQRQTKARGRLGRTWDSNNDDGVWMSVILTPSFNPFILQKITLIMAVSIWQTLSKIAGVDCQIKWPNDILLDSKKICGILCESQFMGTKSKYVIAGVGININQNLFEDDLQKSAISLKMYTGKEHRKDDIINEFVKSLQENYKMIDDAGWYQILEFYKSKCSTLGKFVRLGDMEQAIDYKAIDVNESGNLILSNRFGEIKQIVSNEIFEIKN